MTHKTEIAFLQELEARGNEERRILKTEVLPEWARGLGEWLVVNPWRVLIPISLFLYGLLRVVAGPGFITLVLKLFGGF